MIRGYTILAITLLTLELDCTLHTGAVLANPIVLKLSHIFMFLIISPTVDFGILKSEAI